MKLYESERRVMAVLWKNGPTTAKRISEELAESCQWSKTTSYTVIRKCLEKGYLRREYPDFLCVPLVSLEDVQEYDTDELIDRNYNGSADLLLASLIRRKKLDKKQMQELEGLMRELEEQQK